jgi:hypothetical protein
VIFGSVQINGHQTTEQCTGQGGRGGEGRESRGRPLIRKGRAGAGDTSRQASAIAGNWPALVLA